MSTDRDVTRIVRSWLEEGRTTIPDRVLVDVFDQLPATPQRRLSWPARRFHHMSSTARFMGAIAAVVVVAGVGLVLALRPGGVGGKGPPLAPSTTSSASASALPLMLGAASGVDLPPGTYLIGDPFPIRATLTVPAGWTPYTVDSQNAGILVNHGKPADGSGWGVFFLTGPHFYMDPCRPGNGTVGAAAVSTADKVVATLRSLPSIAASQPVATTVGGRPAVLVTLTAGTDTTGCRDGGATFWQTADGTDYVASPGQAIPLRVVDVDGQPIVIMATDFPESSHWETQKTGATPNPIAHANDQIELRQILDSIRIEGRTPASPGPTAAP